MTSYLSHNGSADAVRQALVREGYRQSAYRLSLLTGYKPECVKLGIRHLLKTKEIVCICIGNSRAKAYYDLVGRHESTKKYHGVPAGRITIGRGSKWGSRVGGQIV